MSQLTGILYSYLDLFICVSISFLMHPCACVRRNYFVKILLVRFLWRCFMKHLDCSKLHTTESILRKLLTFDAGINQQ